MLFLLFVLLLLLVFLWSEEARDVFSLERGSSQVLITPFISCRSDGAGILHSSPPAKL